MKKIKMAEVTREQMDQLEREAFTARDYPTVADCVKAINWHNAGRKGRCKAALRILKTLNDAAAQKDAAE